MFQCLQETLVHGADPILKRDDGNSAFMMSCANIKKAKLTCANVNQNCPYLMMKRKVKFFSSDAKTELECECAGFKTASRYSPRCTSDALLTPSFLSLSSCLAPISPRRGGAAPHSFSSIRAGCVLLCGMLPFGQRHHRIPLLNPSSLL